MTKLLHSIHLPIDKDKQRQIGWFFASCHYIIFWQQMPKGIVLSENCKETTFFWESFLDYTRFGKSLSILNTSFFNVFFRFTQKCKLGRPNPPTWDPLRKAAVKCSENLIVFWKISKRVWSLCDLLCLLSLSLSFPAFKTLVTLSVRSGFSLLLLCFVILIKNHSLLPVLTVEYLKG